VRDAVGNHVQIDNKVHMVVEQHFGVHMCLDCHASYQPIMVDGVDENMDLELVPIGAGCYDATQAQRGDATP